MCIHGFNLFHIECSTNQWYTQFCILYLGQALNSFYSFWLGRKDWINSWSSDLNFYIPDFVLLLDKNSPLPAPYISVWACLLQTSPEQALPAIAGIQYGQGLEYGFTRSFIQLLKKIPLLQVQPSVCQCTMELDAFSLLYICHVSFPPACLPLSHCKHNTHQRRPGVREARQPRHLRGEGAPGAAPPRRHRAQGQGAEGEGCRGAIQ